MHRFHSDRDLFGFGLLLKQRKRVIMPEYTEIDHSISEHTVSELHPEKTTPQGTQFEGVLKGHEHRDISVRIISRWFFGLFCFVVAMAGGLAWMFFGILHYDSRGDQIPAAIYKSSVKLAPLSQAARLIENEKAGQYLPTINQAPPLMPDPHQALIKLRTDEDTEVNSYGFVKGSNGKTVHIPIDSAMTIALQKGFPVTAKPSSVRPPAPVSPALEPAEDKGF
jgi:hypothetical protein